MKVGYVRATSDQPQLWHRDPPLELQTIGVEHAFSCFIPVNLDCPMDGRENMFVYGSGSGVPYPWQEVSMSMLAGDLWTLSSYVIHRGRAVLREGCKGCNKGAQRVLEPPFQQKGGGVENPAKRTVSDKSENQPPKGA